MATAETGHHAISNGHVVIEIQNKIQNYHGCFGFNLLFQYRLANELISKTSGSARKRAIIPTQILSTLPDSKLNIQCVLFCFVAVIVEKKINDENGNVRDVTHP